MSETSSRHTHADAGEALVAVASAHGTGVFFGVVSIHNQPLVDAAARLARFVPVRHEAAAVNAADGFARASGGLGVAITSTGTGAGNAAGSLVEALTAGSRVLHVTGQIDSEFLGGGRGVIHESKDQRGLLEAVSKSTATVLSSDTTGLLLEAGARSAVGAPQGPTSVEIPIDLQYRSTTTSGHAPSPPRVTVDPAAITAAAALVAASKRPALWLGGGAVGARAQIANLAAALGVAVFTSNAGRGTIDERHPAVIGNFASSEAGSELLGEADLLLSIGTHFRSNETRHYELDLPSPHVQVDVDAAGIGRVHPADVGLVGDAAAVVAALLGELGEMKTDPVWTDRIQATRAAVREKLRADIGPYADLCEAMRSVMAEGSPFVRDVTIPSSSWGNRLLPVYEPSTNINARGGGIGQGLAMAIGAAVARPEVPTMIMVGDGGLAVHLGELGTLAQERPWLVAVLFNDGGYGVLRNLQDHHFGRRAGVDLATPDFSELSSAYGIDHFRISGPGDCRSVLEQAVAVEGPAIVEVDCETFGPMPRPFVPPVAQPAPSTSRS